MLSINADINVKHNVKHKQKVMMSDTPLLTCYAFNSLYPKGEEMDLGKALSLLKTIIEKCHFDEIGFTSAKHSLDDKDILDIIIQENVYHWQFQELDSILLEYDDIEMEFDSGNDQVRIFRKEPQSS